MKFAATNAPQGQENTLETTRITIGDADIEFRGAVISAERDENWSEDRDGTPIAAIAGVVEVFWSTDMKCDRWPESVKVRCWCWADCDDDGQWGVDEEGAKAIAAVVGFSFRAESLRPTCFIRRAFLDECHCLGLAICQALRNAATQEAT